MARLVSYKDKDYNRYSTFENDNRYNSNENLTTQSTFKLVEKKAKTSSTKNHTRSSNRFCDWCNSCWQKLCPCVCCKKCCDWWWRWCCCCCCCCIKSRCCARCTADQNIIDDVTDEIDKQFAQYKCEMQLKQINDTAFRGTTSSSTVAVVLPRVKGSLRTNTKRPLWNWDDSLRSNSDKFLETLEYDVDGQKSLTKSYCSNKISSYFKGIYLRLKFCFFFMSLLWLFIKHAILII